MPQIAPETPLTECLIQDRVKEVETYTSAPYCFRCNVWVDPDTPHVPLIPSEDGDSRIGQRPE